MTGLPAAERDRLLAAARLIGHTGARTFELGYERDDPADPGWWARASYGGDVVRLAEFRRPTDAAEALLAQLIEGGRCTWCHRPTTLTENRVDRCRYRRQGDRYERGCAA